MYSYHWPHHKPYIKPQRHKREHNTDISSQLSLNLLTTVLLSSPTASASIIDTTGTFPVSLLADILSYRLASETTQHRAKNRGKIQEEGEKAPTLDSKVGELLARVAISRVFDIEGVWEVVGEVARGCELAYARRTEAVGEEVEVEHLDVNEGEDVRNDQENSDERQVEVQPAAEPIMEIGDSEEEEEENVVNVDVDLDAREISLSTAPIAQQERTSDVSGETDAGADREINVGLGGGEVGTEVVILDNMTAVVSELFSRMEKQAGKSSSLLPLHSLLHLAAILKSSVIYTYQTVSSSALYPIRFLSREPDYNSIAR